MQCVACFLISCSGNINAIHSLAGGTGKKSGFICLFLRELEDPGDYGIQIFLTSKAFV